MTGTQALLFGGGLTFFYLAWQADHEDRTTARTAYAVASTLFLIAALIFS